MTIDFGNFTWSRLGISLLIVVGAFILRFLVKREHVKFTSRLEGDKKRGTSVTVERVIYSVVRMGLIVAAVVFVLQINGVNITAAIAGLGIASAAVALAFQDTLKDLIMGIRILAEEYFFVGDGVVFDGEEGIVIEFNLITTKIEMINTHYIVSVSNRLIEKIVKLSNQVDIDIPLSYEEDPKRVHELMKEMALLVSDLHGVDGAVYKGTQSFEESSILYRIRFYCHPEDKPDLRRAALGTIQKKLWEEGISIPFNQLDVHFDDDKKQ